VLNEYHKVKYSIAESR